MKAIEEKRKHFEKLWIDGGGHFKYYKFADYKEMYTLSDYSDGLSESDLSIGLRTLNIAWVFYIGGWQQSESMFS